MSDSPHTGADPLLNLPRLSRRHARLAMRLRRAGNSLQSLLDELAALLGTLPRLSEVDVIPRSSGLKRPGAIAQLSWPRLGTRIGLGLEPSLAHAIVDRLLGFDRTGPEHKHQVSPIEWGVLGFVVARLLDRLADSPGPFGPWDLHVDRVGPEPFLSDGLGPIVTLAWPISVGPVDGVARLWVPEMLVGLALVDEPPPPPINADPSGRLGSLVCLVRVDLGVVSIAGGAPVLEEGQPLPIQTPGGPLGGTPETPSGPISLVLGGVEEPEPLTLLAALGPAPEGGLRITIRSLTFRNHRPPESLAVPDATPPPTVPPGDLPADLVVELSRMSLPLARVADLKPGDMLDLPRSPHDPVSITSGGTLVARGSLVQLDDGLAVKITRVFT